MNTDEKVTMRLMFRLRVFQSDGDAYEDLFTNIMSYRYPRFTQIKPQGRIGDRRNDGFDRSDGTYYQVFAPENLANAKKAATDKLADDFAGLKAAWDDKVAIQQFRFALNDKYQGSFPSLEDAIDEIRTSHSIEAEPFLAKDLENEFFQLPDDQAFFLLGRPPAVTDIQPVKYSAMNEVVAHLIKNGQPIREETISNAPDFEAKLSFNGVSRTTAVLLQRASYQVGDVDGYFSRNSDFTKEHLRDIFAGHYRDALAQFDDNATSPSEVGSETADLVFYSIMGQALPEQDAHQQNAVLVLMAYFFEACDIYEEPT